MAAVLDQITIATLAMHGDLNTAVLSRDSAALRILQDQAIAESDVDLLVEFESGQKTFTNFSNLAVFLEELFGRPVELVTTESLSPYIGPHILREVKHVTVSA